jgi:acyl carrier protein
VERPIPRQELRGRLIDALVAFSDNERFRDIGDDDDLRTHDLDSLTHFNFLLSLEQDFGFEFPEHKLTFQQLGTVGGILDVLSETTGVSDH